MLKVKNSKAHMIGYTVHDIEMDKKARINTIGVTWEYNTKDELNRAHADHIINAPSEIVKILEEL